MARPIRLAFPDHLERINDAHRAVQAARQRLASLRGEAAPPKEILAAVNALIRAETEWREVTSG